MRTYWPVNTAQFLHIHPVYFFAIFLSWDNQIYRRIKTLVTQRWASSKTELNPFIRGREGNEILHWLNIWMHPNQTDITVDNLCHKEAEKEHLKKNSLWCIKQIYSLTKIDYIVQIFNFGNPFWISEWSFRS